MDERKNKKFISEKIIGREMTARRAVKYILVSILSGLVFGAAAFCAFMCTRKIYQKNGPVPAETAEAASVSEDETGETETENAVMETSVPETSEDETEAKTEPESAAEEGTSPAETALSREDVKEIAADLFNRYEYDSSDYISLVSHEKDVSAAVSSYIVTVDSTISETTWFESTIETRRSCAGIIVAKTDQEILVLTVPSRSLTEGQLSVTFAGGARQNAILKKTSARDGLSILAVPVEGLGSEFLENVKPVAFAGAAARTPGEPVIAAGAPMGVVGSFDYGFINYAGPAESGIDSQILACYTDVNSRPELGTFLLDLYGRLIGIACEKSEEDGIAGTRFISSQSLFTVIESLKKSTDLAYLGISGTDISFDMKYKNVPEGFYIDNVEDDSPAFAAGLKRGDILTGANETEIKGTDDYMNFFRKITPGDEIRLTAKRAAGVEEYTEIEFTVTAGTR